MSSKTFLAVTLVALALAGCASSPNTTTTTSTSSTTTTTPAPTTGGAPPVLAYTATQNGTGENVTYAFEGPATATPGWTTFTLANHGSEMHQIVLVKLPPGATFQTHKAMMGMSMGGPSNATAMAAEGTWVGGVGAAAPGGSSTTTVKLTPGTYVMECQIPGPAGAHADHGMVKELTVSGAENGAAEPTSDLTLSLVDFNFTWSKAPTAGNHTVKVVNAGGMVHEAILFHLAENKTVQDVLAWEQTHAGAPPVLDVAGAGALSPTQVEYVAIDLASGSDYGLACFMPDAQGRPHIVDGMIGQVHIA